MLKIKTFLGLNENPDGSTALKVGEMSEMRNFRITKDGHLQLRPGSSKLLDLSTYISGFVYDETQTYLHGVWNGIVGNAQHTLVAFGGHIFDVDIENGTATDKGTITEDVTSFFGFGGKVYVLNGHEYKSWDGQSNTTFADVTGYVPTIYISTTPAGEGTKFEERNYLIGTVKMEFNSNGSATQYVLKDQNITSVDEVKVNDVVLTTGYTPDLTNGKVTFSTAPTSGTNNVIIKYTKTSNANRTKVTGMHYSELYNGTTDSRVFLYGNGTNIAIYSGIDQDTEKATAEYFPEKFEVAVGEENTPITALVRHYSRMMAYKPNSTYQVYGQITTLSDGTSSMAYYVTPVNRQFGNEALGQVRLLENNPISLDSGAAFQWKAYSIASNYASNEQNASRISDNVSSTLGSFDFSKTKTNNLKYDREFWFICNRKALILNYYNNSWYIYEGLPFDLIEEIDNTKYGFSNDGKVYEFDRSHRNDEEAIHYTFDSTDWEASAYGGQNGTFTFDYIDGKWYDNEVEEVDMEDIGLDLDDNPTNNSVINVTRLTEDEVITYTIKEYSAIDAYAATGSMDFDKDWLLKYSPMLFVATQPESNSRVTVTVETNKRSDYQEKVIAHSISTFLHLDFNHFSFGTNRKPQVKRVKLKVKKATYYKMIFKSNSTSATVTVLETDIKLRYAGEVK